MEENANKLHLSAPTVYAECIYTFFIKNLFLVAECHVDCWQTLQWRLLWRISGATDWSQKYTSKKTVTQKIICNQYGRKLAILNTKNIKICGWITKLEAIKIQFSFSFISAEYLQKIRISNFPRWCSDMPKVAWLMLYRFCSKFHALFSSVKFLKISWHLAKLQRV